MRGLPGAVVGVAPHSLRAVTAEELEGVVKIAQGEVIHIHIAEQTKEVQDCIAWSGRRPSNGYWRIRRWMNAGAWCMPLTLPMPSAGMAASKAVVGLCPITEANLGDGIFPAPSFVEQGGRFGVGSDSNVSLDGADELRVLEYSQRLAQRRATCWHVPRGNRQGGVCLMRRWPAGRRRSTRGRPKPADHKPPA